METFLEILGDLLNWGHVLFDLISVSFPASLLITSFISSSCAASKTACPKMEPLCPSKEQERAESLVISNIFNLLSCLFILFCAQGVVVPLFYAFNK